MSPFNIDPPRPKYPPIPVGTHHAVCYGVVDVGTHITSYKNAEGVEEPREVRGVLLFWEFPNLKIEGIGKDGKPNTQSKTTYKEYTAKLHKSKKGESNLSKVVRGLKGNLTDEQALLFDLFSLIGENALLQIVPDKNEAYTKISTVSPLMAGLSVLKPETPILKYHIDEDGFNYPSNLPDWIIKKKIETSLEYLETVKKPDEPLSNPVPF